MQVANTKNPAIRNSQLQTMLEQSQTPSTPTPHMTYPGTESSTSATETTQPTTPTPNITRPSLPHGDGGSSSFSNGIPSISSVYSESLQVSKDQSNVDVYFSGIDPDWDPLIWV